MLRQWLVVGNQGIVEIVGLVVVSKLLYRRERTSHGIAKVKS